MADTWGVLGIVPMGMATRRALGHETPLGFNKFSPRSGSSELVPSVYRRFSYSNLGFDVLDIQRSMGASLFWGTPTDHTMPLDWKMGALWTA